MNPNEFSQSGGCALSVVTGGASGIGLACVRRLLARGDAVVVIDLPGKEGGLGDVADVVKFYACDVADERQVEVVASTIQNELGKASNLVNSAGVIQQPVAPESLASVDWDRVVAVDQKGTYLCCVAFGGRMATQDSGGSVVNIASIAGSRSMPLHAYAPAKAAVISMTQCLAVEWGRSNVRVNSVSPGYTLTPALQDGIERGFRDPSNLEHVSALGRLVRPQEIADAVEFLTSERAAAITGVDLPVDAGWLVASTWATYNGVPDARIRGGGSGRDN